MQVVGDFHSATSSTAPLSTNMSGRSSSLSSASATAPRKDSLKTFSIRRKPTLEIVLNDPRPTPAYTTLDRIGGEVVICAAQDTPFDDLHITFEGALKTYVESISAATNGSRTESAHRFLRLVQPLDDSSPLPHPRVAEAGRTYRIPFVFVVPEQLLPGSCQHQTTRDAVHAAHLQLPPSLADGTAEQSDLAPEMARISYTVKARLTRLKPGAERPTVLCEATRPVRVRPAVPEEPPLSIPADDRDYTFHKTKTIRKGLLKGKLGTLTIEAQQPRSFHLPPLSTAPSAPAPPASTVATVYLRFDPVDASARPPQPSQLSSKLRATTYFAASPFKDFPSRPSATNTHLRGQYTETVSLSTRNITTVQWEAHHPPSSLSPSFSPRPYYTLELPVPLALPKSRAWVPSFHACLASRVYALDLTLSLHAAGPTSSSLALRLPVQVSAEGALGAAPLISPGEADAIAAREGLAEYLVPRRILAPSSSPREAEDVSSDSSSDADEDSAGEGDGSADVDATVEPPVTCASLPLLPPEYSFLGRGGGLTGGVVIRIPEPMGEAPRYA